MATETTDLVARAADDQDTAAQRLQARLDAGDDKVMSAAARFMRDASNEPDLRATLLDLTASTGQFTELNYDLACEFLAVDDPELNFSALAVMDRFPQQPRALVERLVSSSDPDVREAARSLLD